MRICWILLLALIIPLELHAETPQEKGLSIAREADRRDSGWKDQQAVMIMILRDKQGNESRRNISSRTLEVHGDGDKSLIVFNTPRDINGTAFLTFSHALEADEQWLYLPALKRVKRISSSSKSGPFMGSEFAYEDIASEEVDKYSYKYLRDEKINGRDTFVIERYPQYQNSGYTRQVVWLDQEMYVPLKTVYYDRKNSLLKTLLFSDHKQYMGKFWRPATMEMTNHQKGKSTTLLWEEYQFNTGLSDRDFDKNSLKRAR